PADGFDQPGSSERLDQLEDVLLGDAGHLGDRRDLGERRMTLGAMRKHTQGVTALPGQSHRLNLFHTPESRKQRGRGFKPRRGGGENSGSMSGSPAVRAQQRGRTPRADNLRPSPSRTAAAR